MNVAVEGGPIAYLAYTIPARPNHPEPDAFGVLTVMTYIEEGREVKCRGAVDCLRYVFIGAPYQVIGGEHSSFGAAEAIVKQRCPNPMHSASY